MKVLHLTAGNLYGGIETFLVTLARLRHLCPAIEPHYGLCFPGRLRDELLAAGVPVHDLGAVRLSRPWTVWQARRRLHSLLRQIDFVVAITHGCWPHVVFAPILKKTGIRLVYMTHDYLNPRHWLNRWAARTSPELVVANSRYTQQSAAAVFPQADVEVVYLPVPRLEVDHSRVRAEMRQQLGVSPETVVILQASRLERWKGQTVHLEALAQLRDLPQWQAWIAGGPQKAGEAEFLAELQGAIRQAGIADRVKFLGQRRDIPLLMAAADIYCQPNTDPEPFGITFVEALHAGLPVVTSNFGGAAEIITPDCGILCPPSNTNAVAEALRNLITDPQLRRSLGAVGPNRALTLCNPFEQIRTLYMIATGEPAGV